jgi:predicted DNA-binding mobile mystery protein A
MKRIESQVLRLKQLNASLALQAGPRPVGGWLKAVRQASGLSLKSVAGELKLSPQAIHQLEKSEAAGTISIKQLSAVSGTMGCDVVYALVPRRGTFVDLSNPGGPEELRAANHSMALEGQAVERPDTTR